MTDEKKKKIVRIVGVGGAAAVVPHLLGYQPAVDDVTMMVIAGPDVGAVTNMVGGLTGPHLPLMFAQASQVLGRGTQVAIFGWSDELSNRTLAASTFAFDAGFSVEIVGVVEHGEVTVYRRDGEQVDPPKVEQLRDFEDADNALGVAPAASRQEALSEVRETGELRRGDDKRIYLHTPTARAEIAGTTLDKLADTGTAPLTEVREMLACISTRVVRDAFAVEMVRAGHDHSAEFLAVWRSCDPQEKAWLAPVATLAHLRLGSPVRAAQAVLLSDPDPLVRWLQQIALAQMRPDWLVDQLRNLEPEADLARADSIYFGQLAAALDPEALQEIEGVNSSLDQHVNSPLDQHANDWVTVSDIARASYDEGIER